MREHLIVKVLLSRYITFAVLFVAAGMGVANLHELAAYPLMPYADSSFPEGCPPSNFDATMLLTIGYFTVVGIAVFGAHGSFARLLMLFVAVLLALTEISLDPSHLDGQHCGEVLAGYLIIHVLFGASTMFISSVSSLWYLAKQKKLE